MNYNKRNIDKKQKEFTTRKVMKQKRVGIRCFKASLFIIILICIAIAAGIFMFFKNIVESAPEIDPDDVSPIGYTSFIVDQNGNQIEKLLMAGSNRIYKPLEEIPVDLQNAFIAIEDSRFREHIGIDPKGIIRAGVVGITSGTLSEGASTITQQLIKNSVFVDFMEEETLYDRVERKVQEIYLAIDLEKQISKDVILENYLNTINLGQNTLGVESAAQRYFGKTVSELTLSECAVIAGITKNPSGYNPISYPERNLERRDKVLDDMAAQGFITVEQRDEAIADDVYSRINTFNETTEVGTPYSYFTDTTIRRVLEDMQSELGYSYEQATTKLYSGGVTIVSTQDAGIQQIVNEEFADSGNFPSSVAYNITYALSIVREDGTSENYWTSHFSKWAESQGINNPLMYWNPDDVYPYIEQYKATYNIQENDQVYERLDIEPQPQAAFSIIDQSTGYVKALIGGRGEKDSSLSFNRADEPRQTGSSFKIVSTYAPGIDTNTITLGSVIKDEPVKRGDGSVIRNYSGGYQGDVTVRYAINQSLNTIAAKVYNDVTPQVSWDYLMNFGFTTLVHSDDDPEHNDIGMSTALGGLTHGVSPLEMTGAYAALANNGIYNEPILYTQILDHDGTILLDNTPETHTVVKETTAALMTNAMRTVITNGTGRAASIGSQPIVGKTGTTNEVKDLWFCGYSPYYTASLWVGMDQPYDMTAMGWNENWHKYLWSSIMKRVHESLPVKEFVMPSSIKRISTCVHSGLLPTSNKSIDVKEMEDYESILSQLAAGTYPDPLIGTVSCKTRSEYYAPGTQPTSICPGTSSDHDIVLPAPLPEPEPLPDPTVPTTPSTPDNGTNGGNTTPPAPTPTPTPTPGVTP